LCILNAELLNSLDGNLDFARLRLD
jgi:hypothetical protein